MANKTKFILLLSLCILLNYTTVKSIPTEKLLAVKQAQSVRLESSLKIISSISTVKRGGTGAIIIQGIPRTRYTIRTSYQLENRTIPVTQSRTTDNTGVATFNWIVDMKTTPGTYNAVINGGSDTLNTTHIVLP